MWPVNHPPLPYWFLPPPSITNQWYVHQPPPLEGTPSPDASSKRLLLPLPPPVYPPPWTVGTSTSRPPQWQFGTASPPSFTQDQHTPHASLGFKPRTKGDEGLSQNATGMKSSQPETSHGKSQWFQMKPKKETGPQKWYQGASKSSSTCDPHPPSSSSRNPIRPPSTHKGVWFQIRGTKVKQMKDSPAQAGGRQDDTRQGQGSFCTPESLTRPTPVTQYAPVTRPTPVTQYAPMTRPTLIVHPTPMSQSTAMFQPKPTSQPETLLALPKTAPQYKPKTWSKPTVRTAPYVRYALLSLPTPVSQPTPIPQTSTPSPTAWHTSVSWPTPTTIPEPHPQPMALLPGVRSVPEHTASDNSEMDKSHLGTVKDTHSITCDKNVMKYFGSVDIREETISDKNLGCNKELIDPGEKATKSEECSREIFSESRRCDVAGHAVKREELDDAKRPQKKKGRGRWDVVFPTRSSSAPWREPLVKTEDLKDCVKTKDPAQDAEEDRQGDGTVWKPFCESEMESEDCLVIKEERLEGETDSPLDFDFGHGFLMDKEFLETSMEAVVPVCCIQLPLDDCTDAGNGSDNIPAANTTLATANTPTTTLTTANTPTTTLTTANTTPTTTLTTANTPTTTLTSANTPTATLTSANTTTITLTTANTPTTTLTTATNPLATANTTTNDATWSEKHHGVLESPDDDCLVIDLSAESLLTQIFEYEENPNFVVDTISLSDTSDASDHNTDDTNHQTIREGRKRSFAGKNREPGPTEKYDPFEFTTDDPDVVCVDVVTNSTGRSGAGKRGATPTTTKSATTERRRYTSNFSSSRCPSSKTSSNSKQGPDKSTAKLGSMIKYPTVKSSTRTDDDTVGHLSKEEMAEALKTCSYVLMDEVSDICPVGHKLDPSSATLNVSTRRVTVPCPTCNITIYMDVK